MSAAPPAFTIDAIAFDLDGTLLDTVDDLAAAVNRLLESRGLARLPASRIRDLIGKGIAHLVVRAVEESRGTPPDPDELASLLADYDGFYTDALGRETVLFEGVVQGLERLREAGFRLGVVTNKASRFVAPHLRKAGIAHYFDASIGGDDASAKKPAAAPLLLCAQRLGVAPAELLMVGDSINDTRSARAAGCPVVVVPYGYNEGRPVEELDCDGIFPSIAAIAQRVRRTTTLPSA